MREETPEFTQIVTGLERMYSQDYKNVLYGLTQTGEVYEWVSYGEQGSYWKRLKNQPAKE